eukprot:6817761-Prymnesium_polylepis.1
MRQISESRSKLRWLPDEACIPSNVRIIVSCLPDDDVHNPDESSYRYGCATRLEKLGVPTVKVGAVVGAESDAVVSGMLAAAGRALTTEQRSELQAALGEAPTVLLCRLSVDRALRWQSSEVPEPGTFPQDVDAAINGEFDRLEKIHGEILVKRALAYLTWSTNGLSSAEMIDVCSLDDEILRAVFEWWMPSVVRLPSAIWLTLRDDLGGLL